ncbi:N-carbamoylputrescine amidase [Butyrivibrio hungatei DSM 14810]|uniref:N-carbamoylputrescine amidase n=1 Tax=Butyrivibrio hungatei DSM 14810 TaxID=1121132 RepID=A0A1M7S7X6_9FIRM|nr:N-carbamoylputrescine amidase [Butyrivibrio hungatei]SHN54485.1 N-carbamoylputrescine amidase [Butyrivibrio hungatei DSM 14810]
MANKIKVACIQYACGKVAANDSKQVQNSINKAEELVRKAASNGAKIILLSELFERKYFCQERRYDYYDLALPISENPAVLHFQKVCKELKVVMPISVYEKDGNTFYNSVAMIDADGSNLGTYRKTHIPDDHYYQEKFYFTPGNTGFKVFDTEYGRVGVGICWDQWFPETARCLALKGADIILYPTAIGSEPILEVDSSGHWMRTMQGHSAANIIPVAAANRIGREDVEPSEENGGQRSSLTFYGNSFLTDETGDLVARASRDQEEIIYAEYDFDEIRRNRSSWGLFRDRRPECYTDITK